MRRPATPFGARVVLLGMRPEWIRTGVLLGLVLAADPGVTLSLPLSPRVCAG